MMRLGRTLSLKNLISALEDDHREIRRKLLILRLLILKEDYETAKYEARELQLFLRNHIAEEDRRVRKVLGEMCDKKEELEVREIFEKHRQVLELLKEVENLTRVPLEDRWRILDRLGGIISEHMKEEDQHIFDLLAERIEAVS